MRTSSREAAATPDLALAIKLTGWKADCACNICKGVRMLTAALDASRPQEPAFNVGELGRWHERLEDSPKSVWVQVGYMLSDFAAAAPRALTPPAEHADLRQRLEEKA